MAPPGMPTLMVGMKPPCTEECAVASGQATQLIPLKTLLQRNFLAVAIPI
ncbi:hypothetical protein [Bradyrhizobium liaoningense]